MPDRSGAPEERYCYSIVGQCPRYSFQSEVSLTPQHLARPYTFTSLEEYKDGLRKVGDIIRSSKANASAVPIVVGVTGYDPSYLIDKPLLTIRSGNVSNGARDMLDTMGVKWISPDQLSNLDASSANVRVIVMIGEQSN